MLAEAAGTAVRSDVLAALKQASAFWTRRTLTRAISTSSGRAASSNSSAPPAPDPAASAVGGAIVGGVLGGLISGRPVGAAVGAITGGTIGAIAGAQAAARPGYYLAQGNCYYRYPSGQYVQVDPRTCY